MGAKLGAQRPFLFSPRGEFQLNSVRNPRYCSQLDSATKTAGGPYDSAQTTTASSAASVGAWCELAICERRYVALDRFACRVRTRGQRGLTPALGCRWAEEEEDALASCLAALAAPERRAGARLCLQLLQLAELLLQALCKLVRLHRGSDGRHGDRGREEETGKATSLVRGAAGPPPRPQWPVPPTNYVLRCSTQLLAHSDLTPLPSPRFFRQISLTLPI